MIFAIVECAFRPIIPRLQIFAWRITARLDRKTMAKESKPPQLAVLRADTRVKQGLQLTTIFMKLQEARDREQLITLAERLLDEQNSN
jgi:hypothetical protein